MIRNGAPYSPAPADEKLKAGDTLFLVGAHEDLMKVMSRLEGRRGQAPEGPPAGGQAGLGGSGLNSGQA